MINKTMLEELDTEFILKTFQDVINDYNLEYTHSETEIKLKNDFCKMIFYLEYGELECDLYSHNSNTPYPLKTIPHFGFDVSNKITLNSEPIYEYLTRIYKEIIKGYLHETLKNGNFDWVKTYTKNTRFDRKIHVKLFALPIDNPIYLKFHNGDNSWRKDIVKEFPELQKRK